MEAAQEPEVIRIACHQVGSSEAGDIQSHPRLNDGAGEDTPRTEDSEEDMSEDDLIIELRYFRAFSGLSTFLRQDTAGLLEDSIYEMEGGRNAAMNARAGARTDISHRFFSLQHPLLNNSRFTLLPAIDVVWLSHEMEPENAEELRRFYGDQLDVIENVIVEEIGFWDDLDKVLKVMEAFKGVRIIYVWLESYRFDSGVPITTESGYLDQAKELQARDQAALQGRPWMVEYMDHDGKVYGGFRSYPIND